MDRILAVVVSYHPTFELIDNIECHLMQVPFVVVVDNESSDSSRDIFSKLTTKNVFVISNEVNQGVATGFNQGVKWGLENGYDYFLLLDQDSRPEAGMVEKLLAVTKSFSIKNQLVLVGPHLEDYDRKMNNRSSEDMEMCPLLITSGSLLSKDLIEKVGFYDDRLFIDHVDHEYCLRVVQEGGRILKVNSVTLLHRFGDAQVKTFLGKSFFLQSYSSFRRYHMMRNRLVLYKRFGMFRGEWFWLDAKVAFKDLVKLILFESDKRTKLKAIARGFLDGVLWKDD